ncbi:hypothetical protein K458DRAFT_422321 [Lentithecium fluviatile CBS 122367]|uniref:Uncharacterized protein n=1 Tax=Lentithecium fluviatile CBS 122367 TaxID=1168545 RepID=A0A6G1IMF7_9PLEO|nr:hypothetical protein K458DRAFT_422321 [Lentithecium fluviatile CBS 122367]
MSRTNGAPATPDGPLLLLATSVITRYIPSVLEVNLLAMFRQIASSRHVVRALRDDMVLGC